MPDEKKQASNRRTSMSMVPGLIVLSIVILAIVVMAVVFLSRMGLLEIPFLGGESTTPADTKVSFAEELLSRLPPPSDKEGESVFLTITPDELETIVSEASKEVDHYHRMRITYSSGVKRITYAEVVSKGGKFRADLKDSQGLVLKRMLYDTVRIQVFDGATGHSKVFALNEWFSLSSEEDRELLTLLYGFSPKGELGLPSMSDVLTLLDSEEISDYEIRLVKEEKRHYILVSFTYTLTGVKEEYELDLETGIVLGARSSLDGVTYYTVETEEIRYNVSEYEDSYFKIQ